jgi:uncharacterized delta-60 repeat protein
MEFTIMDRFSLTRIYLACCLAGLLCIFSPLANAKEGIMDRTFGVNGNNSVAVLTYNESKSVLIQPDGKLIVCGSSRYPASFALVRFQHDGSLDLSFGVGGKVTTTIGTQAYLTGCALQADGGIVAAGYQYDAATSWTIAVVRYKPDGSLDTGFGSGGIFAVQFGGRDYGASVRIQDDGKIVVAGRSDLTDTKLLVVRLNPSGSLDPGFAAGGVFLSQIRNFRSEAFKVDIQADGKLVILGSVSNDTFYSFSLVRLNSNGTVDTGFGDQGLDLIPSGPSNSFRIDQDGRFVVLGYRYDYSLGTNRTVIMRFTADGMADQSFGVNGRVEFSNFTNQENASDSPADVAIQSDGKIVVLEHVTYRLNGVDRADLAVARLHADGTLDQSFGTGGKTLTSVFGNDQANALAIQRDGRIVVAGTGYINNGSFFEIVRYIGADAVTCDFDGDGKSDISVYRTTDGNWYLLRSATNTFSAVHFGTAEDVPVPADYDGDLKADIAVYRPSTGVWYEMNSSNSQLSTVRFGLSSDIPTPADYDGDGKADITVYRPADGTWYGINSFNNQTAAFKFGISGDRPVPGDYDGDGKADYAVWRISTGVWYYYLSQSNSVRSEAIDYYEGDRAAPADYDGDGKADTVFWRNANGNWYGLKSSTGSGIFTHWGAPGDIPVPADYDGDGRDDFAVWRPSTGTWWMQQSSNGGYIGYNFGQDGDIPLTASFIR